MSTVDNRDVEQVAERDHRSNAGAFEVHRNAGLAAVLGAAASGIAIAWLGRAVDTGSAVDWVTFAVIAGIGVLWLRAFVDARTPLLVADGQGVRIRLGGSWHGLPWADLERVEHHPRTHLLRDGRIVLVPADAEAHELDGAARRAAWLNTRLVGAPFAVPLGLSTRVPGLTGDLTATLRRLAAGQTAVIEPARVEAPLTDAGTDSAEYTPVDVIPVDFAAAGLGTEAFGIDDVDTEDLDTHEAELDARPTAGARMALKLKRSVARMLDTRRVDSDTSVDDGADTDEYASDEDASDWDTDEIPTVAPDPVRALRVSRRSEVVSRAVPDETPVTGKELRRPGSVNLVEETQVINAAPEPIVEDAPIEFDDLAATPAPEPVIGPELAAARHRIGLTVDALAERTRIRPHVIESIEVDDFAPCGGDFYARGHLRTLARVLGVDASGLLTAYDERYSDAPINATRVFEAELATGVGGIRGSKGGPNWSVMVAAVMAVILAWSVAKLVMDDAKDVQNPAISLSQGSGGPNSQGTGNQVQRVTIKVTATNSTTVKITNARGKVVFTGPVAAGDIHRIDVLPPVKVQAGDAGAVDVEIDGDRRGAVGLAGSPGSKTYRVAR